MSLILASALTRRRGHGDQAGTAGTNTIGFANNLSPSHRRPRRGCFSQPRVASSAATRGEELRLDTVIAQCRDDPSPHTELSEIKANDCGPSPGFIPVVRQPIWIRNRPFFQRGEITGSIAHQPVPRPFPEGELFDSPGFAAPRLPWVRDIHMGPEPCRGSLHAAMAEIGLCVGFRHGFGESNSARGSSRQHASSHLLQR